MSNWIDTRNCYSKLCQWSFLLPSGFVKYVGSFALSNSFVSNKLSHSLHILHTHWSQWSSRKEVTLCKKYLTFKTEIKNVWLQHYIFFWKVNVYHFFQTIFECAVVHNQQRIAFVSAYCKGPSNIIDTRFQAIYLLV